MGALILGFDASRDALRLVDTSEFYHAKHRAIFESVRSLAHCDGHVDILLVKDQLQRQGELHRAGGEGYLTSLIEELPSVANWPAYARLVREAAQRRRLRDSLIAAQYDLEEPGANLHEIEEKLKAALEQGRTEAVQADSRTLFDVHYVNPSEPRVEPRLAFIEGLLFPGYTNLSGPWKCGKTWLGLALSLCVHTDTPCIGQHVNQAECAWLQLDMDEASFQQYAQKLAVGMQLPERRMPYFYSALVDLVNPTHQTLLIEKLKELGTQILWIDSSRAASSIDESKSEEVRLFVRGFLLQRLRNECAISTVLLCHPPKGGAGPRGSGDWSAGADSLWEITPPTDRFGRPRAPEPGEPTLFTLNGYGRHPPFRLEIELQVRDSETTIILLSPEQRRAREIGDERIAAAFKAVLVAPRGLSQNRIEQALKEAGLGVHRGDGKLVADELLRRYPEELSERREKGGRYDSRIVFPTNRYHQAEARAADAGEEKC